MFDENYNQGTEVVAYELEIIIMHGTKLCNSRQQQPTTKISPNVMIFPLLVHRRPGILHKMPSKHVRRVLKKKTSKPKSMFHVCPVIEEPSIREVFFENETPKQDKNLLSCSVMTFSQRYSCPEITDQVCSLVADDEVVAVAFESELQRVKSFSIFSRKTGIEVANIHISSGFNDSIVFPSFALTRFHVVVVRLSQRTDKNIACLRVAIYSKANGCRIFSVLMDCGFNLNKEIVKTDSSNCRVAAHKITPEVNNSSSELFYQITIVIPHQRRIDIFHLNDSAGTLIHVETTYFYFQKLLSFSIKKNWIAFYNANAIILYNLLAKSSVNSIEGLFIPFYKPILRGFLMEKIISVPKESDEQISSVALKAKLSYPFLAIVNVVSYGSREETEDEEFLAIWDLSNIYLTQEIRKFKIRVGLLSGSIFSFDISSRHLIFWNSNEMAIEISSMKHIANGSLTDLELLSRSVKIDLNCHPIVVPVLHLIYDDETISTRTSESLKFIACIESNISVYFITIKV